MVVELPVPDVDGGYLGISEGTSTAVSQPLTGVREATDSPVEFLR